MSQIGMPRGGGDPRTIGVFGGGGVGSRLYIDNIFPQTASVVTINNANLVGSISGSGTATFNGPVITNSTLTANGVNTFAGAVTVTGTQTTSGTATFNGPVITNSTLTANGVNTFAGAVITNGAFTANGTNTFSTAINSTNTTNATSTSTGAITTLGGIGVAQDVFVGGNGTFTNIRLAGSGTVGTYTTVTSSQTGNITINMPTASDTLVGLATTDTLTNKTLTSNTDNVTARALWYGSGSGSISGYAAAAPTAGQVPTAVDANTFTWATFTAGVNDVALQGNTTQTAAAAGTQAIAIGRNSSAVANNSIALGQGAVTSVASTFIVQPGVHTTLASSANGLFVSRGFQPVSGNPLPTATQFANLRFTGGNATLLTQNGTGIDNQSISTLCSVSQFPSQSITLYYTTDALSTVSWGGPDTGVTYEGALVIPPSKAATVVWTRIGTGQWLIVTVVGA